MSRNPMDVPLSPQEVGALKARLAADPRDEPARLDLVAWYRRNGHVDQAGRYAITFEGLATEHEIKAYTSMLRGLGADDHRMRELSRLPGDPETEERVRQELEGALAPTKNSRFAHAMDVIAAVSWTLFGFAILVTLITTFVLAVKRDQQVSDSAAILAVITLFIAASASGISAIAAIAERSRIATAVFAVLCCAAVTGALLLVPGS